MPEGLLYAFIDAMPVVRAQLILDMSEAALRPHLKKSDAREWFNHWRKQATRIARAASRSARNFFTFNGRAMPLKGLRGKLRETFGGGFEDGS